MVRYLRTLKTLRQIALDRAASSHPDLAAMARELGGIVHRDPRTGQLHLRRRDWLGPGDGHWCDGDAADAHRCRNLSKHDTAFMLHVCGGDPPPYLAQQRAATLGRWLEQPRQPALAGHLRG